MAAEAWVDLRSDTVTHPTAEMRHAMAQAEVGDDVYGEDPTVNHLEALAAERVGKEAAVFVASGTMGNLSAVLAHCGRGDEVILGDKSHTYIAEAGGVSALGGVHTFPVPNLPDGTLALEALRAAIRDDDPHYPITRLICLENTHNNCRGAVLDAAYTQAVAALASEAGLGLHLDGARLFNAAAALGVSAAELAAPVDSVTFCLSKGLCAPVGSVLCGSPAFIERARRVRKQLGGGMRQAGVLAAAGIVALETMVDRLREDHARARRLAQGLQGLSGLRVENPLPASNMVYIVLEPEAHCDAAGLTAALARERVRVVPRGPRNMRLVLHHDVDDAGLELALAAFARALGEG